MLMSHLPTSEDRWHSLTDAPHASRVDPQFRRLLAALDSGWQVEAPVYLRPRWGDGGPRVYHFILRHPALSAPRLITVPTGAEVDGFVQSEGLSPLPG